MARNISATILGVLAGAAVSMSGGVLLGAYVVTGAAPAYAEAPPRLRAARPEAERWPPADPLGPIQPQAAGVRASGSSSE